jgi:HAD superfamily hydrolase (TIGR01509 family)
MKTILVDAVQTFVVEENGVFHIFKDLYDLLETFTNPKIILTGADDGQYKKFGLDKMPYEVFTLKHNPEKTDPEYFKQLLNKYNLTPEEVVYFEHSPEAVKSAQSVGINTYYYDDKKRDLESLISFLNTNI